MEKDSLVIYCFTGLITQAASQRKNLLMYMIFNGNQRIFRENLNLLSGRLALLHQRPDEQCNAIFWGTMSQNGALNNMNSNKYSDPRFVFCL
jgi:hypothetical protein